MVMGDARHPLLSSGRERELCRYLASLLQVFFLDDEPVLIFEDASGVDRNALVNAERVSNERKAGFVQVDGRAERA